MEEITIEDEDGSEVSLCGGGGRGRDSGEDRDRRKI